MHMSPGSIVWLAEKDETIQTENKDSDCIKKQQDGKLLSFDDIVEAAAKAAIASKNELTNIR